MNLMLTPDQGFVKEGKFDLERALIDVGVKAAICYKEVPNNEEITPKTV